MFWISGRLREVVILGGSTRLDKTRQYFIRGLIPADTSTVFQHFYT